MQNVDCRIYNNSTQSSLPDTLLFYFLSILASTVSILFYICLYLCLYAKNQHSHYLFLIFCFYITHTHATQYIITYTHHTHIHTHLCSRKSSSRALFILFLFYFILFFFTIIFYSIQFAEMMKTRWIKYKTDVEILIKKTKPVFFFLFRFRCTNF